MKKNSVMKSMRFDKEGFAKALNDYIRIHEIKMKDTKKMLGVSRATIWRISKLQDLDFETFCLLCCKMNIDGTKFIIKEYK
jgi:hypothetical protein